jgi:hypothetical protein
MNRVLLALAILLIAFGAAAQTTNGLSDAQIQGKQLAQEILQVRPATNFTETGALTIRTHEGTTTNIPITFTTDIGTKYGYWIVYYSIAPTNKLYFDTSLMLRHDNDQADTQYFFCENEIRGKQNPYKQLGKDQIMAPFADSDFWIADLGLEFFHWPDQKVLRHEDKRTRACAVLESTNPNPTPGAYSRVDSWIDNETLGIVHAEAYDADGKLLKVFDPKSFKKVNGQWELQDMEIRNVQFKSRTSIKFDLNSK